MSYPGHYRARKHVDVYQGLHFGLLDLELLPGQRVNSKGGRFNLHFHTINHEGNEVMEQLLELQETKYHKLTDLFQFQRCIPYWDEVPLYKILLFRASMVTFGMIFVLFPAGIICWLLFAAIYYICIGGELLRRDRIEKRYQRRHHLLKDKRI